MDSAYEMTGLLKEVKDIQTFASGFTKREFILEKQDGNYTQTISFNCLKNNTALLDNVKAGNKVKVTFDIRGREYNGRVFNDLVCFRIEQLEGDGSSRVPDPAAAAPAKEAPVEPQADAFNEDLPF